MSTTTTIPKMYSVSLDGCIRHYKRDWIINIRKQRGQETDTVASSYINSLVCIF